ncbi:ABC transporter substrate-binding protein [Candidatus Contubernalis alkaliaceticus]|uniref:ABC transporter substrate-binding protein n=1 Tax=Candidatus Contubernalis alkaliaceticus TaxID=338645 RepID=UPI001F4C3D14|nr:ABC transporter substrate-binding protein [Candidatus Contubernalis alkalaceticus]UNC93916.1 ABC transporter substrate-binding protein [Candidatus Contubernalis alkalaceticus]
MKRNAVFLLLFLFMMGCFYGCSAEEEAVDPSAASDGDNIEEALGIPQELIIGIGRDFYQGPESGVFVHGSTGVWESFTYLNEDMIPEPQLAEELTPNDDATQWSVKLRSGVNFHDGTPLNAEAVMANIDRILNNPKFDEYGTFLHFEGAEAAGDMEVVFKFNQPEPAFPLKVNYHGFAIFSPASFDEEGAITVPYGTGPFKYEDYIKDEELILTRNDDYWGEKAKLEKVTFKPIPDPSTRLAALQAGEIHVIADVGGVLPEQGVVVEGDSDLVLQTKLVTTSHYILFNGQKAPFNDVNIRQAVSMAVDRSVIVNQLLEGYGEPADSIITPIATDYVVRDLFKTDKNKAEELVKGADGLTVTLVVSSALANRWPYKPVAEVLQMELGELGFEVEIQMMEAAAWGEALKNGDYHMTLTPYTFMTGDPDFVFARWIHSQGQMNASRGLGYSNAEADRLIEEAAVESDLNKRKDLYGQLQRLMDQEVPMAPIFHDVTLYAYRKEVKDMTLDAYFRPSLDKAWIGE